MMFVLLGLIPFAVCSSDYQSNRQLAFNSVNSTLYCDISYDNSFMIDAKSGFSRIESKVTSEHIVPASVLGKQSESWQRGNANCIYKGKPYKGRKCALKNDANFILMYQDVYNLYPALNITNSMRKNYKYSANEPKKDINGCLFAVENKQVLINSKARGIVARAYLYMDKTYNLDINKDEMELMQKWDQEYPVTSMECSRYNMLKKITQIVNFVYEDKC